VAAVWPGIADRAIAVLICITALGAVSALIFTGARVAYALGAGHPAFRVLGRWEPGRETPARALVAQGILSLGIVLAAESYVDILTTTGNVVWAFALGTGLSIFVLRRREPEVPRPYRVTGYPVTPILFCLACAFMIYSSASYAVRFQPVSLYVLAGLLLAGGGVYALTAWRGNGTGRPGD
jgi:amino acid transporter